MEVTAGNLQPGLAVTFVIDNIEVASATAERDGEVEVDLDVRQPGPNARR